MSERWGDSASDRAALDRWITREPPGCECVEECCEDECVCADQEDWPEPPDLMDEDYYRAGEE